MNKKQIAGLALLLLAIVLQVIDLTDDKKYLKHGISIFLIGTAILLAVFGYLKKAN